MLTSARHRLRMPPGRGAAALGAAACSAVMVAACASHGAAADHTPGAAAPAGGNGTLGAAAQPSGGATAAAPGTGVPRCHTGQLSTAFTGLNSASGGSSGMTLVLTNRSGRSCYLNGYARLSLLGGHLTFPGPLPTQVTRVSARHRPVILHPGGNAQALVTWHTSSPTPGGGALEYPQRVEVTPPGASRYLMGMWPQAPVLHGDVAVWPLRPAPPGPVPTGVGTIQDPFNGMCVTTGKDPAPGTPVVVSHCDSDRTPQWTAYSDGTLRIYGKSLCLDVTARSTAVGATVNLWACDGSPSQRWLTSQTSLNPFGPIIGLGSGNVLTDPDHSTADGTQLQMGANRGDQSPPWHVSSYHYLGH